ncbi:MAG: TolB family protein [Kofleriaceae bacterium]
MWPAVFVVLIACGRVDFDLVIDGAVPSDALDAPDTPLGDFGAPTLITELSDPANDDDPSLTADLTEMYFSSFRPGGSGGVDIWRTQRASAAATWGAPQPVTELNSGSLDENPGVAPDGLTIWFSSARGGGLDIYVATRSGRGAPWGTATLVSELSTGVDDLGCEPAAGLLRMVFYRNTSDTLHEATRPDIANQWAAAVIAELDEPGEDQSPFLFAETEIYFSSDRDGPPLDLYRATRASVDAEFGNVIRLDAQSSSANDDDPWVSPDGRTIFFMSDRSGNEEIYMATR